MQITDRVTNILQQYQASLSVPGASSSSQDFLNSISSSSRSNSTFGTAYTLSLSQAAQQFLAQQSNINNGSGVSTPLTLSQGQIERLGTILVNYQDEPLNDATSAALYADLEQAGLLPSQLAQINQANLYDTGEQFLALLSNSGSSGNLLSDVSGLFGNTSSASLGRSDQLVTTLLRYGEISGESRGVLLDARIESYLDLLDEGGLVT